MLQGEAVRLCHQIPHLPDPSISVDEQTSFTSTALLHPDATRGTAASSLDSPSPGPHQPFLEREHQKPYYASNVRNPQEKALLAASKDAM